MEIIQNSQIYHHFIPNAGYHSPYSKLQISHYSLPCISKQNDNMTYFFQTFYIFIQNSLFFIINVITTYVQGDFAISTENQFTKLIIEFEKFILKILHLYE